MREPTTTVRRKFFFFVTLFKCDGATDSSAFWLVLARRLAVAGTVAIAVAAAGRLADGGRDSSPLRELGPDWSPGV